jgi:hypothetical protein
VIAATLRDVIGVDWSDEIEDAWRTFLAELDRAVRRVC